MTNFQDCVTFLFERVTEHIFYDDCGNFELGFGDKNDTLMKALSEMKRDRPDVFNSSIQPLINNYGVKCTEWKITQQRSMIEYYMEECEREVNILIQSTSKEKEIKVVRDHYQVKIARVKIELDSLENIKEKLKETAIEVTRITTDKHD